MRRMPEFFDSISVAYLSDVTHFYLESCALGSKHERSKGVNVMDFSIPEVHENGDVGDRHYRLKRAP